MQFLNDIIKSRHGFKTTQKLHPDKNCNFLSPCLLLLTFATLPDFCEQALCSRWCWIMSFLDSSNTFFYSVFFINSQATVLVLTNKCDLNHWLAIVPIYSDMKTMVIVILYHDFFNYNIQIWAIYCYYARIPRIYPRSVSL